MTRDLEGLSGWLVAEGVDCTARAYAAHGTAEQFDTDIFAGGHQWSGRKPLTWMKRLL